MVADDAAIGSAIAAMETRKPARSSSRGLKKTPSVVTAEKAEADNFKGWRSYDLRTKTAVIEGSRMSLFEALLHFIRKKNSGDKKVKRGKTFTLF